MVVQYVVFFVADEIAPAAFLGAALKQLRVSVWCIMIYECVTVCCGPGKPYSIVWYWETGVE